ncbi:hypothetical protein KIPB_012438, partial [Kipferlia bialata]|eukprot:g12438.t1
MSDMSEDNQDLSLITETPTHNRESKSLKTYVKCKTCSCCCCCTWVLLLLCLLVATLLLKTLISGTIGWLQYMALPVGVSAVSINYALDGVEVTKKLPAVEVGANVIVNARYRGDTPASHLRVFQFSLQHEDWAQPK